MRPIWVAVTWAAACLVLNGCAWTSDLDLTLYEGPEGAVFLERFPERSSPASHPVSLDGALMARLLGGVRIQEQPHMIERLLTGPAEPIQAFRDEDIAFLSPLLVDALALAASDQRVGFRLARTDPSPAIDEGRLYIENSLLHLLLSRRPRHRGGLGRSMDIWTVDFFPQVAVQAQDSSKRTSQTHRIDGREGKRLVVDYTRLLARSPSGGSTDNPERPPGSSREEPLPQEKDVAGAPGSADRSLTTELEAVEERLLEKSREIKALEDRVRELQRRMEEGNANSEVPKTDTRPHE